MASMTVAISAQTIGTMCALIKAGWLGAPEARCLKINGSIGHGTMMLKIIIFFVALALIIYFFDRPIVPEPIERDPTALALAGQIEKCTRIYGNEATRKKNFANCQSNCSTNTDDKIRMCIDACQAIADQFSNCANQGFIGK
jgi:hypothetical protein